ncbi:MAG TPA: tRNA (adenosine(37)-N6)-dimethylallyltransferase MiaA [Gemmatimonadaceae bacterium]|nr:tRNA (adenosine(37)-N6)-dimethylallyltransferase MiaA [Gemmatimonadaceae bacterium]
MRDVAVICGPTAAGKSAIAMALAAQSGAMLISADSRQVYRRFDIGTAKPARAERVAVTHRGIDVIEPTQRYSAAEWCAGAMAAFAEADRTGQPVIVVGGTGFYLRALDEPLFESPPLDSVRRAELQAELGMLPTELLRARCESIDPARAHLGRAQLLRALEVHALTGRALSLWMAERARPATVRARYLVVDPGAALRDRIAARVESMLAAGWEAEVATLAREVPIDAPAWNACGYANLHAAMLGTMSRSDAIERTVIDTRQYAKRQRTWFRHQLPADRTTSLDPAAADAMSRAAGWFESASLSEHL